MKSEPLSDQLNVIINKYMQFSHTWKKYDKIAFYEHVLHTSLYRNNKTVWRAALSPTDDKAHMFVYIYIFLPSNFSIQHLLMNLFCLQSVLPRHKTWQPSFQTIPHSLPALLKAFSKQFYYTCIPTINTADFTPLFYYLIHLDRFYF